VIAGAIFLVLAVAFLAGSVGWLVRDRSARLERTEREANAALFEASAFQARAQWPEALEAVRRAEGLLAAGARRELHSRAQEHRDDIEMVLRLEQNRLPRPANGIDRGHDYLERDKTYAKLFRNYGIDVETLDPGAAGALIRARTIRGELTAGLDDWVDLRRRYTMVAPGWKHLVAVARAADSDPWRTQLRDALDQGDRATAIRLAEAAPIEALPIQSLELLCLARPDHPRQVALLRRAQRQYPDDYWINFMLAYALDYVLPPVQDQDEAIRFYTAAVALRPRYAPGRYYLARALQHCGRGDEAVAEYQKAIESDPDFAWPRAALCAIYLKQGKPELAIALCQRAVERNAKDSEAHELLGQALSLRGRTGESIREYETALALEPDVALYQNNLAWTLATCAETGLRNPSRALELAKSAVERAKNNAACWNTLGVASYRASDWNGAKAALEKSISLQSYTSFNGFFLAMAEAQLGHSDAAMREFDRALRWMQTVKPDDEVLRRFRAEAVQVLKIEDRAAYVSPLRLSAPAHGAPNDAW
jgi:serine/threonine-protein kinase